jgi:hypothetical protein
VKVLVGGLRAKSGLHTVISTDTDLRSGVRNVTCGRDERNPTAVRNMTNSSACTLSVEA